MNQLEAAAMAFIRRHVESSWTLEAFTARQRCEVIPARNGQPSVWVMVGGRLSPTHDGGKCIRLRPHQIGVAFYWPGGRDEYAVFDVRRLWDDIVNPKPVQLEMWPEAV